MSADAFEKLAAKKWDELEAIEHEGRTVFFDAIRRRTKDGKIIEVPIGIRVLRKDERIKARLEARKWAAQLGIDKEADPEIWDDCDTLCILARAIRDREPPHDQHLTYEMLQQTYEMRSLEEIWEKYGTYEDKTDPRDAVQSEDEFWALVAAMLKARDIRPLIESAPLSRNASILRLAELSVTSPTFKSWSKRFESSTPAV